MRVRSGVLSTSPLPREADFGTEAAWGGRGDGVKTSGADQVYLARRTHGLSQMTCGQSHSQGCRRTHQGPTEPHENTPHPTLIDRA